MANVRITLRDIDLFSALDRCPLTVRQIRGVSTSFATSFCSDRRLQDRLVHLTRGGLLRRFRYAGTEGAGEFYYVLTAESYRLLHGPEVVLPTAGAFAEIGISRHHHSRALADFIVRTVVAAREARVEIVAFWRENSLRLDIDGRSLYPDCAFTLRLPDRPDFRFYVELDNSTEPLTSLRDRDSWQKKLRFYERFQDNQPDRFRVLGVVTKSPQRLRHLLALAAAQASNPNRSLLYGIDLRDYLSHPTPLFSPLFADHRRLHTSLLPSGTDVPRRSPAKFVAGEAGVC